MGWDGAGNYSRVHNFSADASAGIKILASRMDAEINDVASAFSRVWTRDGQNTPTADLPMGGRRFVNVGAPTSVSQFMRSREFIENVPIFMQDTAASADRISVSAQYFTSVSANQAPGDGTKIMVRVLSNKSSAVLYLDGHSANVEYQGGVRPGPILTSGGVYEFLYSSSDTAWKIQNPDIPGLVENYGAVGDATTDDTTKIQAALNSGHKKVILDPNKTYLVSHAATTTINSVTYRYSLTVPQGVAFDLNGSTLKLAGAQNTSIVAMLNDDSALFNGVLDSNRTNQTSPATGEMAGVLAYDVDRIRIETVKAVNSRQYAGRFLNCRDSKFVGLLCTDSYGDGWAFGTTGAVEFRLVDCEIDKIHSEDCEGAFAGLEGNGIIVTAVNTRVGSLFAKDCHGGTKIQNSSTGVTIASSVFDGDDHTYGGANCGTKVQGDSGSSLYPTGVSIANVLSRNCYGNGLVINDVNSVAIGSYQGYDNGSGSGAAGSDQNDVEINTSDGTGAKLVKINSLYSDNPDAIGVKHQGSGNFEFDSIVVRNPTGVAYQDTSSGRISGRRLLALDDQGGVTLTYAFQATATAIGRIDSIETNLTHSATQSRVTIVAANYSLEIGSIRLGSTDLLDGVLQLTNGATSTTLTCGHLWRDYVGGAADYFHPIIEVKPWDTSARALSGNFAVSAVVDGSSGTGATVSHPSAGAADYVIWKVLGWKVVSQAAS